MVCAADNKIGAEGAKALLTALVHVQELRRLDLNGTCVLWCWYLNVWCMMAVLVLATLAGAKAAAEARREAAMVVFILVL